MAIHKPSALCQDRFHSSRQVQLHSCSYSCLKGKVSIQQGLGQLWATETQHPWPTDCSAGLNPEPSTGVPVAAPSTPRPHLRPLLRVPGCEGMEGQERQARQDPGCKHHQISWHIVWELLNMPHPHTVVLHWLPFNLRQNYQGKKHFTVQENF